MNISEIAKLAGVSNAAVSRYFNNGYISEKKKEAIRKVVEETGYRPSVQAQTLRTKKTKMIGVILPKIDSSAMGNVVSGILSVLYANQYQLLLADTLNDPKKELEYLAVFNNKQVDGVIYVATIFTERHKRMLKEMEIPVVIIGQHLTGYNCIYHDDYRAFYDITNLMLKKGCRKLGFMSAFHQDKAAGLERYQGYRNAVNDAGYKKLESNYVIADFTMESGYRKVQELLEKCGELDGIICATDKMALGAMRYLKEQGIEVPGQIMVTGQGDSTLTQLTSPSLTTVHYAYEESGKLAAKMLMEMITKEQMAVREIRMGYSIVENESTQIKVSE